MPSPFPGMDPHLENPTTWPDLHHRLISYISEMLQPKLRPNYNARIGERVYLVSPPQGFYPDVTLLKTPKVVKEAPTAVAATPAIREPIELMLPMEEIREPFLEIYHRAGEVITAIEVLSPANKTGGEGYEQYRRKQNEVLQSRAHLVEIDLLSIGMFVVACGYLGARPVALPPSRYVICVSRATDRSRVEAYPLKLQEPLPAFRIPLKAPDPDVVLNLQAVFEKCYENGGYEDLINYKNAPPVPLSSEEEEWMRITMFKNEGI